jgi:hypothetical protein
VIFDPEAVIAGILAGAREAGGVAEATQALDTTYRVSKNDRFLRHTRFPRLLLPDTRKSVSETHLRNQSLILDKMIGF